MKRRRWDFIPLGLLGLLLGVSAVAAQGQAPAGKDKIKALSAKELADVIDQHISAKWTKAKVTPAALASDAEFLRRVSLDLGGRIPKVADARAFLDNKAADKREALINELMDSSQFVDHFSATLRAVMISGQANPQVSFLSRNFQMWLVDQIRKEIPYDQLVREILTFNTTSPAKIKQPGGFNQFNNGASAFFQANENKPENLAAATTRVFLGVRLECAQCHNHPFTDWKKDQFWEFAAFFAGSNGFPQPIQPGVQPQQPLPKGVITILGTGKKVSAKFLDGKAPDFREGVHPRETLADWVTSPANPYFARTAANRMWAHLLGSGLIDPVDDEPSKENPASHPELLKALGDQLVAHDFDLKYLIRAIALSKTYQRSGEQTHESQKSPRLFAKAAVRGLSAEQLFDTLAQATGFQETQPGVPGYAVPVYYNQNSVKAKFVADFASTDHPIETTTSILQALQLMNGKFMANATSVAKSNTLAAVAQSPFFDTAEKVKVLYLATLTRYPTDSELNQFTTYVNTGGPRQDQDAALGDVFWALLNCSEFRLNH